MNDAVKTALVGAVAGGFTVGLIMIFASKKVDEQLERVLKQTVDREVPPRVRAELESTLRGYGLTPETGQRINQLLRSADRLGVI